MAAASPIPSSPCDALATLAAAMVRFVATDPAAWERELVALDSDAEAPEDWRVDAEELCLDVFLALGSSWPPPAPNGPQAFGEYARQLQRLDRWHAPTLPTAIEFDRSLEHEEALDRLFTLDRFNTNTTAGAIIPRESPDAPFLKTDEELYWSSTPSSLAVVNSLLHFCAYLPPSIRAGDPDDENKQDVRALQLIFIRCPAGLIPPRQFRSDVRIAVAPVLEASTDAELWTDGDRYSIHPCVPEGRLVDVVRKAIDTDADLLLLPEMSVDERLLTTLQRAVVEQRQEYYGKTNKVPRLGFVICGVLKKRDASSPHRNYVAVLDADGSLLFEQDKLSHWNLNEAQQRRFGIFGSHPVPLMEDTRPGDSITVAELPGLGRLLTLICADISAKEPRQWVADNIGLDWLHAPIMDGSICWTQPSVPWIIERTARTACTGMAAVVTNSMPLTQWNNDVIRRESARDPSYQFRLYKECGIALAAVSVNGSTKMQHVTEPLPISDSPVVHVIAWPGEWVDMP